MHSPRDRSRADAGGHLDRPGGAGAVVLLACSLMQGEFDPTVVLGPVWIAGLAVVAYRALEREAACRQRLLRERQETQGDLVDAQHSAGVMAERGLTLPGDPRQRGTGAVELNLLFQAAEQSWMSRPGAARKHVAQAAGTARDGLEEVRRVVRGLAPSERPG